MAHIVVLGAGLGGAIAAYEVREKLRKEDEITVVSKGAIYQFVPSNPWVAVNWRKRKDIEVDLRPVMKKKGINFVDVGTSGGVYGLERGYSLMIGGDDAVVKSLDPIFKALCPGVDSAPRTPGRTGEPSQAEYGFLHCGPVGAGHFVKMIHNGIEYGMMAAFAEGLAIFEAADEMTPAYNLDIPEITEVWRRGSVVASWLLDLTAQALNESNELKEYSSEVSDSGEGRWTVQAAIEAGIPAHVLSASLYSRFASRNNDEFANRVLSAMRYKFGGHNEKPKA